MILVTGATGNVGRDIVGELCEAGHQVRALSRDPSKITFPPGVEVVAGDLTNPDAVTAALEGIQKVFLMRVPGGETFPKIAAQSGVKHIVFLSSGAIESGPENAIGRNHLETEESIREADLEWTFLRPGAFMSNALQWAGSIRTEGIVRAPFGDMGNAPIDPRDIANVAAKVLIESGHEGKIYHLTGPEVLTPIEQVRILSNVLGKEIRFENMSEEIARETMTRFIPSEIVDALLQLMSEAEDGPTNTVGEITGRPPRTFQQWAVDNADAFR